MDSPRHQQQLQDDLDQMLNKTIQQDNIDDNGNLILGKPGPLQTQTYQDYLLNDLSQINGGNDHNPSVSSALPSKQIHNSNINEENQYQQDHMILSSEQELELQHQQELNAVVESISFGKVFSYKKLNFQAISAAISHSEQVSFVKGYLSNVNNTMHSKFPSAKNKIVAYRVNQLDPIEQVTKLSEGFDDDGEPGSGEKLLSLLQKMEIENILVFVCIWNTGAQIGQQQLRGGELFKVIVERAKELLTTIHDQIVQQEMQVKKAQEEEEIQRLQGVRKAINAKVYNMGVNDQNKNTIGLKGNKATMIKQSPTNANAMGIGFRNDQSQQQDLNNSDEDANNSPERFNSPPRGSGTQPDDLEQQIIRNFQQHQLHGEDLAIEDYQEAQREVDDSLRNLTKAGLMELRQFSKPHPLVEKTIQIVCALKGFKNYQWQTAKEILGRPHFKMDLVQTKPRTMRAQDVLRAQQLLNQKGNVSLTPQNVHLHSEAAALLLVWSANIIKLFACAKKLGVDGAGDGNNANGITNNATLPQPLNYNDIQRISARTKIMVKKDIQQKKHEEHQNYYTGTQGINGIGGAIMNSDQINIPIANRDYQTQQQSNDQQIANNNNNNIQQSRQQMQQMNQKSGTIGHFLQNKQMVFSIQGNQLAPENKGYNEQQQPQLVDLSVIKKGAFNSVTNKSKQAQKQEQLILKQEEERMFQEQSVLQQNNNNSVIVGSNSKQKAIGGVNLLQRKKDNSQLRSNNATVTNGQVNMKNQQHHGGINEDLQGITNNNNIQNKVVNALGHINNQQTLDNNYSQGDDNNDIYTTQDHNQQQSMEDMPGRLKIHEVRDLSDDVDDIIGKLKGVDYGIQELDVLIELAKTLKHKRMTLFPDTSNILMSDNFPGVSSSNTNNI